LTAWTRRVAVLVALLGVTVLSDLTWAERRQDKELNGYLVADRIDLGVLLHVVVQDPNGVEYVRGKPTLRIIRTHPRGGMLAVGADGARWVGRSRAPVQWYCSEDAEPLILHDDSLPDSLLVYGSEGAGKTTAQAMWCYFRALERISQGHAGEIGMTAPTAERAGFIKEAIEKTWSPHWVHWNERHQSFRMPTGLSIKLRSTKRQSVASGSPIQGYNWSDAGSDEIQDSLDADSDIESRLRDAPGGRAKRFATATAKDSPEFRAWRDKQMSAVINGRPLWHKAVMLAARSPFMWPGFIDTKRAAMTEREFRRRYGAEDLGPERQLYYSWSHAESIRPRPLVGAADVTLRELAPWSPNASILLGHDPGKRQDVTLFLKAYQVRGQQDPWWFVVDEVTTDGENYENHVASVVARLRGTWGTNLLDRHGRPVADGQTALVRADPFTDNGRDEDRPDLTAYRVWQKQGLDIRPAAFRPGTAVRSVVPKEARIDMVNTLLCAADGNRRLYVACDDRRLPVAPKLVDALETMERDVANRAEWERKDGRDKSHWPAALGYALWAIEKPRLGRRLGAA
jgi:hypothetical protein